MTGSAQYFRLLDLSDDSWLHCCRQYDYCDWKAGDFGAVSVSIVLHIVQSAGLQNAWAKGCTKDGERLVWPVTSVSPLMCSVPLCCMLFCSSLFYAILFILFYSIYSVLFYSILFSVLFCSIMFYFIQFYSVLFYSNSVCLILFYSVLFLSNSIIFCCNEILIPVLLYSVLFHYILFYSVLLYSILF